MYIDIYNQHLETLERMSRLRGVGSYPTEVLDLTLEFLRKLPYTVSKDIIVDYNKSLGCVTANYLPDFEVRIYATNLVLMQGNQSLKKSTTVGEAVDAFMQVLGW